MSNEGMLLEEIRAVRGLTLEQVAERLDIREDGVAWAEMGNNMLLSTLHSYVEGIGGRLKIMVEFPDGEAMRVRLETPFETGEPVAAERFPVDPDQIDHPPTASQFEYLKSVCLNMDAEESDGIGLDDLGFDLSNFFPDRSSSSSKTEEETS